MEQLRQDMAELKATQIFFREIVTEMKTTLSHTSQELHNAALTMERVAVGMEGATKRMDGHDTRINEVEDRVNSLEASRDKQNGIVLFIGGGISIVITLILWGVDHLLKFK